MKIWTDERTLDLGECPTVNDMVEALRFKGNNIRAKADPEIFFRAADMLAGLQSGRFAWQFSAGQLGR